ncbi:hypothetical protein JCM11491_005560 [Sporobolomyces phaffii]
MHRPAPLSSVLPAYLPHEDLTAALAVLASNGLSTDVDLVFGPRFLPPNPALSPELYSRLRSFASSNLSAHSTNGTVLLSRTPDPSCLSTSVPGLDNLLGLPRGGYLERKLIELVGTPSSGRTVLALYAALLYLLEQPGGRVAYLDSSGTFDPFRCLSILKQVLIPRLHERGWSFSSPQDNSDDTAEGDKPRPKSDDEIAMNVLERVSVSRITKSGQALDKISDDASKDGRTKLGVVVIDQIDHLLGGEALSTTKSAQGHANLIAFTRRLSSLANSTTSPLTVFVSRASLPLVSSRSCALASKSPAIHLVAANPQPPPITSLPVLSSIAPHGLANALSPPSSESWPNLIDVSLVCIKSDDVFSARGGASGGTNAGARSGTGPLSSTARRKDMVTLVEVAKNSKGAAGTGLIGIKIENGIKLSEI